MKHFNKQGSLSFGTTVAIGSSSLHVNKREHIIPIETISEISLDNGHLQVKDLKGLLRYHKSIESIPDALIIPEVFKRVKKI